MHLVQGTREHLASYTAALRSGWSPDNVRGVQAAQEQLGRIEVDADAFLASLWDPEAKGGPVKMPDGSTVTRIPGFILWMWDGAFCGSIGFRWVPGTEELPPHCLGHIGYAVVPWKRRLGYATQAVRDLLPRAKALGLKYVEITTDVDNDASQRVVTSAGGIFVERFVKPAQYGHVEGFRYRIDL